MRYIKVAWIHDDNDEPILIFSEIDSDLREHRKIEVFRNGHKGYADSEEELGGSMLGKVPWPDLNELGAEPDFEVAELKACEFEEVWASRRQRKA